ncbi:hypothetical protein BXZ70DRAFT_730068 [Cristinia sonorae]|uniref:Uncharacterized protein n=1 Tax=Cristinia sonorae TaxID=1940300 RepID=A0A8K0UVB6_9AGAR|nr:hypothetical protein BXZ70DRAFT_730068 [Cristinia sonorae]
MGSKLARRTSQLHHHHPPQGEFHWLKSPSYTKAYQRIHIPNHHTNTPSLPPSYNFIMVATSYKLFLISLALSAVIVDAAPTTPALPGLVPDPLQPSSSPSPSPSPSHKRPPPFVRPSNGPGTATPPGHSIARPPDDSPGAWTTKKPSATPTPTTVSSSVPAAATSTPTQASASMEAESSHDLPIPPAVGKEIPSMKDIYDNMPFIPAPPPPDVPLADRIRIPTDPMHPTLPVDPAKDLPSAAGPSNVVPSPSVAAAHVAERSDHVDETEASPLVRRDSSAKVKVFGYGPY